MLEFSYSFLLKITMQWHLVTLFFALLSCCYCGVLKVEKEETLNPKSAQFEENSFVLESLKTERDSLQTETNQVKNLQTNFPQYAQITSRKFIHATPTYPQYPPAYPNYYPYYPGFGGGINNGGFQTLTPTIATVVTPNGNFTIISAFPAQIPGAFPGQFVNQFPGNVFQVNGIPSTLTPNTIQFPTIVG